MDDLGGALRRLARDAAPAAPVDAADLWKRGRVRVRRRRVVATGAVLALAAVVFGGTFAVAPSGGVDPAGTDAKHSPAVPKNVYAAKDWYPTTKDDPPGVVAVLGGLIRGGNRMGLFVVSATTGEYRLLDLPRLAVMDGDESASLSPDGRHIAYWLSGKPAGTPLATAGDDLPVGLAVYDAVTGRIERYRPATEHGISADGLAWVDNDVLLLTYGQRTTRTASVGIATYAWRPFGPDGGTASGTDGGTGRLAEPTPVSDRDLVVPTDPMPRRPYGLLAAVDARRFAPIGWNGPETKEYLLTLPRVTEASYTDATTSREYAVVGLHQDSGTDELRAGPLAADGSVPRLTVLDDLQAAGFVGWLSERSILVQGRATAGDAWGSLYSVDLRTSTKTRLGTAEGAMYSPGLSFATDLLARPMVTGEKPPQVDPRWRVAGGAAALVLLGALVVPYVRRRRRG